MKLRERPLLAGNTRVHDNMVPWALPALDTKMAASLEHLHLAESVTKCRSREESLEEIVLVLTFFQYL